MVLIKFLTVISPWFLKRRLLKIFFKYNLDPSAFIGFAWVFPRKLTMHAGARIEHFSVAIHLDDIQMYAKSKIGRSNWITGLSVNSNSKHFRHQHDRKAELIIGEYSSITKHHHLDCSNSIIIGRFCNIAGYQSQLLTHSIDIIEARQDSKPIRIGDYSFVGTNVVILGGAELPSYSVLGAKSMLNKKYTQKYMLYAGVPAKPIQAIPETAGYFTRMQGFIY